MITIIDYGLGNLTSVANALNKLSIPCRISDRSEDISTASALVLPGVGAAGEGMKNITLDFQKGDGLIPAIVQDDKTGAVLMLGYMNQAAFKKTKETGFINFWSRSRQKLWLKGEESGNKLKVKSIFSDCDSDTILVKVELIGNAVCYTGSYSCFFNDLSQGEL
jgi:phosphoribosyl-ATP pyrophosphohydrolase/phosphoribosyl-AMP cyclohydrolase